MRETVRLAEPVDAFGVEYPAGLELLVVQRRDFATEAEFPMPEGGHVVGTLLNKYTER